jgi:hypothetical protein
MRHHTVIGLICKTHGLLRPGALELLTGRDLIVHGGDVGELGDHQPTAETDERKPM